MLSGCSKFANTAFDRYRVHVAVCLIGFCGFFSPRAGGLRAAFWAVPVHEGVAGGVRGGFEKFAKIRPIAVGGWNSQDGRWRVARF